MDKQKKLIQKNQKDNEIERNGFKSTVDTWHPSESYSQYIKDMKKRQFKALQEHGEDFFHTFQKKFYHQLTSPESNKSQLDNTTVCTKNKKAPPNSEFIKKNMDREKQNCQPKQFGPKTSANKANKEHGDNGDGVGKEKWVKVDDKVTIVNGKLVYSQPAKMILKNEREIIGFLHKNGVKLKDYIYGHKQQIIDKIVQSHQRREKEEIEKYINKNMKQEEAVQMTTTIHYERARAYMFDD